MPRKSGSKKAKAAYPHGRHSIAQAIKRQPKSERRGALATLRETYRHFFTGGRRRD